MSRMEVPFQIDDLNYYTNTYQIHKQQRETELRAKVQPEILLLAISIVTKVSCLATDINIR